MGMTLDPVPISQMSMNFIDLRCKWRGSRKQRPTINSLPLPYTGAYLNKWHRVFMPSLVKWAGSIDDPFGANGKMNDIIVDLWENIYPDIPLNDEKLKVVIGVVSLSPLDSIC